MTIADGFCRAHWKHATGRRKRQILIAVRDFY